MKKKEIAPLFAIAVILLGLAIGSFLSKDTSFSTNENRYLQQKPELTWYTLMSGDFADDAEKYMSDQIALREFWMESKSTIQNLTGKEDIGGAYIGENGYYFAKVTEDTFNQKNFSKNLGYIQKFFENNAEKDCRILLAPTPATILYEYLPAAAQSYNASTRYELAEKLFGDAIIDTREAISAVDEPYYHTDHHWTTQGAYAAYQSWCAATDHEARPYELTQVSDHFHGTLYSKVLLPDSIYDKINIAQSVSIVSMDCDGTVSQTLYDYSKLEQKDHYEVFMGGNWAKVVIATGAQTAKSLLLVKDSFANSFVPFLCGDYDTITIVDLRYCRENIQELAEQATDILVLYEMTNFADDSNVFKTITH